MMEAGRLGGGWESGGRGEGGKDGGRSWRTTPPPPSPTPSATPTTNDSTGGRGRQKDKVRIVSLVGTVLTYQPAGRVPNTTKVQNIL